MHRGLVAFRIDILDKGKLSKLNGDWLIVPRLTDPYTNDRPSDRNGRNFDRASRALSSGKDAAMHLKSDARKSGINLGLVDCALSVLRGWWMPECGFVHARFKFLVEKYLFRSDLFFDAPSGFRQFASQTYLTLACYRVVYRGPRCHRDGKVMHPPPDKATRPARRVALVLRCNSLATP